MRWAISAAVGALLAAAPGISAGQETAATLPQAAAPASILSANAVVESDLRSFDAWEVGSSLGTDGTLPSSLWKSSDAVAIGAAFDKITKPVASPVANRLIRGVLLSSGAAPSGSDAAAKEAARKRFAALGRFGAANEIVTMISASPAAASDSAIVMFAAQADLARGRTADACRRGQAIEPPVGAATSATEQFLLRLRAYCYAAGGDSAAADIALEVARGAGINDPWLYSALPAIAATDPKAKPAAKYDNSLDAAVSVAGEFKAGAKPLVGSSLLAMSTVARAENAAPLTRAEAAKAAMEVGAIESNVARQAILSASEIKPTKAAPVPVIVGALKGVAAAPDPLTKAKAIADGLNAMLNYGDFVVAARLMRDDIATLPKDATTASYGTAMARAMLALGDAKSAAEWRNLVVQSPSPPPETVRSALDAALVAAGQGNPETAKVVVERRISLASGLSLKRASRDVLILQALGVPAPSPAAGFLNANQPVPPTAKADATALAAAVQSSQRGAQGETALNVAAAIAPGADKVEIDSVVTAIQALRAADLMEAARAVAIEAMIAQGIS